MIGVIGVKRNVDIEIREKLALYPKKHKKYIEELLDSFKEVVIVNTCNRTEIYFNCTESISDDEIFNKIFGAFNWNDDLKNYMFLSKEKRAVTHLMEVICGFHSRILGEDQILGQIKDAYKKALEDNSISGELQKMFEIAIACGKKFKTECKMFEVPVSSVSISINSALLKGCKKFMVLGYGEIGKLAIKHLLCHKAECIYLIVRDKSKASDLEDEIVEILDFNEKNEVINEVDCIVSCTAAPHTVVRNGDIKEEGERIYIYDLAVPRDVDKELSEKERIILKDIDEISKIDDKNKQIRKDRMEEYKHIVEESIEEFLNWLKIREISSRIRNIKIRENEICKERIKTFSNKGNGENSKLAEKMIKSTADAYVNRAIELLKSEALKGSDSSCVEIIEKIFLT
ncbi:glutamyl-tRNA reductase [Clostridium sp. LIBA-8841]|uniref:glutamyl-tRNA reductase n=1 Tax=Clostridium sp. LIBA-8841 TaxID=2987530 RepID=UPI002AC6C466|nr:glutamyl-tRNA reductase [Clostridium sp. LIBA-8841]MDZ5252336.1 glutamyl-tRNA reductase [Clostridium sp. LIBA-8841]